MEKGKKKTVNTLLLTVGFLAVGFIGVLAGHLFVNWRNADAGTKPYEMEKIPFAIGEPFPNVTLTDIERREISLAEAIRGQNTIILYITPTCGACHQLVRSWIKLGDQIPSDLNVIMVSGGDFDVTMDYMEGKNFPFPVYCDTLRILNRDYHFNRFPRIMGIDRIGRYAFLVHGPFRDFTPESALDLFEKPLTEK